MFRKAVAFGVSAPLLESSVAVTFPEAAAILLVKAANKSFKGLTGLAGVVPLSLYQLLTRIILVGNIDTELDTAILSRSGNNMGVNFAIPINFIKDIVPDLLLRGQVIHGWIGLSAQSVSAAIANRLGFGKPTGALVLRVTPRSPAAQAGIRVGDIIVAYDGKAVGEAAELRHLVARTVVGRSVGIYLHRDGMLHRAVLDVRELPSSAEPSHAARGALLASSTELQT